MWRNLDNSVRCLAIETQSRQAITARLQVVVQFTCSWVRSTPENIHAGGRAAYSGKFRRRREERNYQRSSALRPRGHYSRKVENEEPDRGIYLDG